MLVYEPGFYLAHPAEILQVWKGGMSFHGGLVGVALAGWLFCRRRRIAPLALGDLLALAAPVGLGLGRLANFINGELWGRVTDAPWGMVFRGAGPLPRHPSQLYEALGEGLLLLGILWLLALRADGLRRPGEITGLFLVGYAAARTTCEFFREPDGLVAVTGFVLTTGQCLSLPMALIGIALIVRPRLAAAAAAP